MQANMGSTDRKIRFGVGVAVIVAGVIFKSWLGLIGLVLIGTAFLRWCPAYLPFHINTIASKESSS